MVSVAKIGDRIRALREEKGLTQQGLADALHLKRETINMWGNGLRDLKTGALIQLSEYFCVSCDYILTGVSAQNREISKSIGLSDNAIDNLVFLKENAPSALHVVSDFLCDMERMLAISSCIDSIKTQTEWAEYIRSKTTEELMEEFNQENSVGIVRITFSAKIRQAKYELHEIIMQWLDGIINKIEKDKSKSPIDKTRLKLQMDIESYIAKRTKEAYNAEA